MKKRENPLSLHGRGDLFLGERAVRTSPLFLFFLPSFPMSGGVSGSGGWFVARACFMRRGGVPDERVSFPVFLLSPWRRFGVGGLVRRESVFHEARERFGRARSRNRSLSYDEETGEGESFSQPMKHARSRTNPPIPKQEGTGVGRRTGRPQVLRFRAG